MLCNLCPNHCNVNRNVAVGKCKASYQMTINRIAPHHYEEPPISGTRGSGTIFFGGCVLKCDYCQNHEISRIPNGKTYTPYELSEAIRALEDSGVHNINFVTPTHYSDSIKKALDIYKPNIPTVYNCGGYEREEIIKGLNGYIDIFLPDFKYSNNALGEKFSHIKGYAERAEIAIATMLSQTKDTFNSEGIMQSGVIVRHLVLPNHLENSKSVLNILHRINARTISLMAQFTPMPACEELNRTLKPIEYKIITNYAEKLLFPDIFTQEVASATTDYIPDFY